MARTNRPSYLRLVEAPAPSADDYEAFAASVGEIDTKPPLLATCDEDEICGDPNCVSCALLWFLEGKRA